MGCVCDHCDNGFASFNGVLHSFEWLQVCGGQTPYIAGATAKNAIHRHQHHLWLPRHYLVKYNNNKRHQSLSLDFELGDKKDVCRFYYKRAIKHGPFFAVPFKSISSYAPSSSFSPPLLTRNNVQWKFRCCFFFSFFKRAQTFSYSKFPCLKKTDLPSCSFKTNF